MANPVLVPIESMDIRLSGVPIAEGLPATGTYMSIAKVSGRTVATEALFGVTIFTAMGGTLYNVTLNVHPGTPADLRLSAAMFVSQAASVLTFSYIHGLTTYTSPAVRFIDEPPQELAADSAPLRAYTLAGAFPVTAIGGFGAPPVIESDQILAAIPT